MSKPDVIIAWETLRIKVTVLPMALAVQIGARTSRQDFQPGDQRAQPTEIGGCALI
jgi:hypothetical protein